MRCFIAFFPSKNVIDFIQNKLYIFEKYTESLKIVNIDKMHITLAFLGNINEKLQYNRLTSIVKKTVEDIYVFKYKLGQFGAFPNLDYPRVYWFSISSNNISFLHTKLKNNLLENGFYLDTKNFLPHITIARVKKYVKNISKLSKLIKYVNSKMETKEYFFDKISIVESVLSSKGPIYHKKNEFLLKK